MQQRGTPTPAGVGDRLNERAFDLAHIKPVGVRERGGESALRIELQTEHATAVLLKEDDAALRLLAKIGAADTGGPVIR